MMMIEMERRMIIIDRLTNLNLDYQAPLAFGR